LDGVLNFFLRVKLVPN
jgi:hypothetical protein